MKAGFYFTKLLIVLAVLLGVNFQSFSQTSTFNYTGTITSYTVPAGVVSINISANGAQGGNGGATGGLGAMMSGSFAVIPGHVLNILTGQQPGDGTNTGGGGGGSFVWDATAGNTLLIAAGGGGGGGVFTDANNGIDAVTTNDATNGGGGALYGGGGTSGNGGTALTGTCLGFYAAGGAGWLTDGAGGIGYVTCSGSAGGQTPLNGGAGGAFAGTAGENGPGGFGGGGGSQGQCAYTGGGGGGGYSGGGGGDYDCDPAGADPGGGGGSFNGGTNQSNSVGNTGNGLVTITITDYVPAFVNGSTQNIAVCENQGVDISSLLAINDADAGQAEVFTVISGPSNGPAIVGLPEEMTSTGGTVTPPSGITYTPNAGYIGVDSFTVQVDDGNGGTATTTIYVTVNATPSVTIDSIPAICPGVTSAALSYSGLTNAPLQTATFSTTGSIQTWTVPAGVTSINITANGAQGGGNVTGVAAGGNGAIMSGSFAVTPGQVLNILVGEQGVTANWIGGGGGGSFVWDNLSSSLLLAAGGGGGAGTDSAGLIGLNGLDASVTTSGVDGGEGDGGGGISGSGGTAPAIAEYAGGGGGWLSNGNNGTSFDCEFVSTGGVSPLSGGAGGTGGGNPGNNADGGFGGGGGGNARCGAVGGGGGGGYSGGGAGGDVGGTFPAGGYFAGGGGGSFNGGTNQSNTTGNTGDGQIVITYTASYNIAWDGDAHTAGFADVTNAPLPASPVTVAVPGTAASGTYNGILTINNSNCTSTGSAVSVTINPTPVVDPVGNPSFCNTATAEVDFTSSVAGTTYAWTNDSTGIGLADSGTGNIVFTATNGTFAPTTGDITVTPTANGCVGPVQTFTITVNPTPDVAPVSGQAVCNGASTTEVDFTGDAAGTTFSWANDNTDIGLGSSDIGNIPSFTATNGTFVPIMGNFTVTPFYNGCPGPAQTFTITVNPTPDVAPSANQTVCNGAMTATVIFTGDVAGTSFSWTNSDTTIGLASSGTGNIDSFAGTNSTPNPVIANIVVATSANGCAGTSNSFTITVEPTPLLSSQLTADPICDSTLFSYVPTSNTVGTLFSWARDTVAGNGAAFGSDNPNEVLVNITDSPVVVTYVYTLFANGCSDTQLVTVVVNPKPMLSTTLTPAGICDSTAFTYVPGSATPGTTFSWTRDSVAGISNAAGSGVDTVNEILVNTTPDPIAVNYVFTLLANDCSNTQTVTVTVNPKPTLSSALTPPAICDSTLFSYAPASGTTGTTFAWSRAVITGIANAAAHGVDTISEILINTTTDPVVVIYMDTLNANGCLNIQSIDVVVNPRPKLSSSLTPPGICDSAFFNYTPTSATVGSVFAWTRAYVLGIGLAAASGTGNPDEELINNTNDNLNVTYTYDITANGCSNTENVVVVVHPMPTLSSNDTPSVCSGADFIYNPTGYVFGSTYQWVRPQVPGISPATKSDTGAINETLTDSLLIPVTTTYVFIVKANGCSHLEDIKLTVNPAPAALPITTFPPSSLCSNTMFQNFGTSALPPAGEGYYWTASNATLWATGAGKQYCLVSFPNPGDAVVTLHSSLSGFSCTANSAYTVNVGSGVSGNPEVIYYNGQFLCLENSDTYQWGFDDAHTLDSTLVPGEVNQTYFISAPDLTDRYYWVMTTHNGCMQKSYYNVPTGITNVNSNITDVKIYPNPTNDYLNVDINTTIAGNVEVQVLNMLGQKLNTTPAVNNRARIDVASLPAGCYLVDCYREGVKIAAARFIKN